MGKQPGQEMLSGRFEAQFRFGLRFGLGRGRLRLFGDNKRIADALPLESIASGEHLNDARTFLGRWMAVWQVVDLGGKGFAWFDLDGHEANAADEFAANVLKLGKLGNYVLLARADCGLMQCVNVVEEVNDELHPIAFTAARLFNLKAKMGFFSIVRLEHEFAKGFGVGGNAVSDLFGGVDGLGGILLDVLPLGGSKADLVGETSKVIQLLDGLRQLVGFGELQVSLILPEEGRDAYPCSDSGASHDGHQGPWGQRLACLQGNPTGGTEENHVGYEKGPFWQFWSGALTHVAVKM